jgi:hypothetical protein
MTRAIRWASLVLLVAFLPSCSTTSLTTVTNLTPTRLPRRDTGQYPFAVEFSTRQRTILRETIRAYVVVGDQRYLMERTPMLRDRYETLVPVPPTEEVVNYRYRFEYEYKAIPELKPGVFDSKGYQLYLQAQ